MMHTYSDAASQMSHDEIKVFIMATNGKCVTTSRGTLIKGMPHTVATHIGTATDAGFWAHLIDNHRIGNEGFAMVYLTGECSRDVTTQIADVLSDGCARVVEHLRVDAIDASRNGVCETATSHNGIESKRNLFFFERLHNFVLTQWELVETSGICPQLFGSVANVAEQHRTFIFVDRHFGGGRTGVDD